MRTTNPPDSVVGMKAAERDREQDKRQSENNLGKWSWSSEDIFQDNEEQDREGDELEQKTELPSCYQTVWERMWTTCCASFFKGEVN